MLVNANAAQPFPLADESVQVIITSPPYWALRSYSGTAKWEGGDPDCDHEAARKFTRFDYPTSDKQLSNAGSDPGIYSAICPTCGAIRNDAQLGSEESPDCLAWARNEPPCGACFICNVRTWAAECWRVLREDGIFFLNVGDSYVTTMGTTSYTGINERGSGELRTRLRGRKAPPGLKPKDLCNIPSRVADALRTDGWWFRSSMPWLKNNPMPDSAPDRPGRSIEWVHMFTKSARYHFDMEAVRVGGKEHAGQAGTFARSNGKMTALEVPGQEHASHRERDDRVAGGRNFRQHDPFFASLRAILDGKSGTLIPGDDGTPLAVFCNNKGTPLKHYATYPPQLIEPLIKAAAGEGPGACAECGKLWERVSEKEQTGDMRWAETGGLHRADAPGAEVSPTSVFRTGSWSVSTTHGHRPACTCHRTRNPRKRAQQDAAERALKLARALDLDAIAAALEPYAWSTRAINCDAPTRPPIILDPFVGSGTTVLVARDLGLQGVGFDLSAEYLQLARQRLELDALANWTKGAPEAAACEVADLPLFAEVNCESN